MHPSPDPPIADHPITRSPDISSSSGFSLVEVLVAITILIAAVVSLSQLFGLAAATNQLAAARTLATLSGGDKIEQLQSTPWTALTASPAAVLETDVDGYSDRVGGGAAASLIRRWAIAPLPADPFRLMVVQVLVLGRGGRVEARIVTVRHREGA